MSYSISTTWKPRTSYTVPVDKASDKTVYVNVTIIINWLLYLHIWESYFYSEQSYKGWNSSKSHFYFKHFQYS
jgi:hypothetical protein